MDRFLSPDDFPGPVARDTAPERWMGEARFDGYIAFSNWRRDDVEALLPADLRLAANISEIREMHPVAFMFGALKKTTILFGGVAIPTGVDYGEFLMAIPFVVHRDGRHLHTFMARMFSGVATSVFVGNAYYGFAKSLATMSWHGSVFTVVSADTSELLLYAAVERPAVTTESVPHAAAMQEALTLPILGRRRDGSLAASSFELELNAGAVSPADAWISIETPILPQLRPRHYYDVPAGTIRVRDVMWRLSWPSYPSQFA